MCIHPTQNNQCGHDQSCTIVSEVCQLGNPSQECNTFLDDFYGAQYMSKEEMYEDESQ